VLTRDYTFDNNIVDIISYGDYLITAMLSSGISIFHKERPQERITLKADKTVQSFAANAIKLKILGSTLFVSGQYGGLQVYDLSAPMSPKLISAGNTETVEALDYYKDRLVVGSGKSGLTILQLPGTLVVNSSINETETVSVNKQQIIMDQNIFCRNSKTRLVS